MSKFKRYDEINRRGVFVGAEMAECQDGDWVQWDDVEKYLEAERRHDTLGEAVKDAKKGDIIHLGTEPDRSGCFIKGAADDLRMICESIPGVVLVDVLESPSEVCFFIQAPSEKAAQDVRNELEKHRPYGVPFRVRRAPAPGPCGVSLDQATGQSLDELSTGTNRLAGETDEGFRARILDARPKEIYPVCKGCGAVLTFAPGRCKIEEHDVCVVCHARHVYGKDFLATKFNPPNEDRTGEVYNEGFRRWCAGPMKTR